MDVRNAKKDPEIPPTVEPGDEGAMDIVSRTGEEMPLAMHDQGHGTFRAPASAHAFDPRLPNRRPRTPFE